MKAQTAEEYLEELNILSSEILDRYYNEHSLPDLLESYASQFKIKTFSPSEFPKADRDLNGKLLEFSIDVYVIDENGLHSIGFYNFDLEEWNFHTDTLIDYNEVENKTKWVWYYPPITVEEAFKS